MLHRKLGQRGEKVSILGFEIMRFPTIMVKQGKLIRKKILKC